MIFMTTAGCNFYPAIHVAVASLHRRQRLSVLHNRLVVVAASFRRQTGRDREIRGLSTSEIHCAEDGHICSKPSICTADELHYAKLPNSDWRLALWRYKPSPEAPPRNHPLLLLSGVGTNAIGYDLSPESSFARYMCGQGFDTWVMEFRGAGLSVRASDFKDIERSANEVSHQMEAAADNVSDGALSWTMEKPVEAMTNHVQDGVPTSWDELRLVTVFTDTLMLLSERVSGFLNEGQSRIMSAKFFDQISKVFEDSFIYERFNSIRESFFSLSGARQNSAVVAQIRDISQRLVDVIYERQRSISPQIFDIQERLMTTINDFQKQLDLIANYDWGFDQHLEEDIPAAMEYIRSRSKPKDGRLFAIGHSMGGILLYARISKCSVEGKDPGFAAIVTLASSLDYASSNSALMPLLPLADPAQALNVPVVPLGALLAAAHPFSSRPPYILSWINGLISAQDMMHPELLKKLVMNNFGTIPAKLLLQLKTALQEGGLRDARGTFFYKDHLHKTNIHVLALAGDQDLICPPEAVKETAKLIPKHLVTYEVFGEPNGPHYAHYDLVGGRLAVKHVYPFIIKFLSQHDQIE